MPKRGASLAGALKEAQRPYRLSLLRALSDLEQQSSGKLFPLSVIMMGGIHDSDVRNALRGLYSAGTVRTRAGEYGLTALGRRALVVTWASKRRPGASP